MLACQHEIEKIEKKYAQLLETERSDSIQREEGLRSQVEFMKTSFHTYKVIYNTLRRCYF